MRVNHAVVLCGRVWIRIHQEPGKHAMNKLRLNLDDLAVDTFPTDEKGASLRGTVDANEATVRIGCIASLKTDLTCCPCTPRF
jgi:hypothetical protein